MIRVSRRAARLMAAFAILALAGAGLGLLFEVGQGRYCWEIPAFQWFGGDLGVRRAEVVLAHERINSFHVWTGEVSVPGYSGMPRPDREPPSPEEYGQPVHAYPPWHDAYCWFYPYLSFETLRNCGIAVFFLCVGLVWRALRRLAPPDSEPGMRDAVALGVLSSAAIPAFQCYYWMSYSVLVVALLVFVERHRAASRNVVAGLLWALAMVKPQMAVLAFWPLAFKRAWTAIATAIMTCLAGTVAMAFVYRESPVDLILQLPQIGAPYVAQHPLYVLTRHVFGNAGLAVFNQLWAALCFAACGALCARFRNHPSGWCRWSPVALTVPLWMYSQVYDRTILVVWFAAVAEEVVRTKGGERRRWIYYCAFSAFAMAVHVLWPVPKFYGLCVLPGDGWLPDVLFLAWEAVSFAMLLRIPRRGEAGDSKGLEGLGGSATFQTSQTSQGRKT